MKHLLLAGVALAVSTAPVLARDLTIQDVATLSRVGSPAVSPDGHWLVWQQRETDLAANKGRYDLWRLDLTVKGAKPEKLVAEADVNETAPQFSADGKTIWFQSDKGGIDSVQAIPVAGGSGDAATIWPGGRLQRLQGLARWRRSVLIWADRKPGAPNLEPRWSRRTRMPALAAPMNSCSCATGTHGATATRSQLFVVPLSGSSDRGNNGVAIEGGLIGDTPSKPFGGGEELSGARTARPSISRCAKPAGSSPSRPISTSSPPPRTAPRHR
jgi:hypothetical protein